MTRIEALQTIFDGRLRTPGMMFDVDEAEALRLTALGAARKVPVEKTLREKTPEVKEPKAVKPDAVQGRGNKRQSSVS